MCRYTLFFLLLMLPASAAWARDPQQARQIHPPQWAVGRWTNAVESNSRRIVYLQINDNSILVSKGVPGPEMDVLKQYAGWTLKETGTGDHYRIEFRKLERTELFSLALYRPAPGDHMSPTVTLYMDSGPGADTAERTPLSVGLLMQMDDRPGVSGKESALKATQPGNR